MPTGPPETRKAIGTFRAVIDVKLIICAIGKLSAALIPVNKHLTHGSADSN